MKSFELQITSFLQSPVAVVLLMIISAIMLLSGLSLTETVDAPVSSVVAGMPQIACKSRMMSMVLAFVAMVFASLVMMLTNRTFDLLRTNSKLYVGLFLLLATAVPGALGLSVDGLLLLDTVLLSLMIMYTTYGRPSSTRRIFLVATLLSAGSVINYAFAAFIPPMLIGCSQMRCLTFRSVLAIGVGVITPLWILWGFDIISLNDLRWPVIGLPSSSTIALYSASQLTAIFGTVVVGVVVMLYNLLRVLGLNARTRAFNGIFATLTFWTALFTIIDFSHALTYIPLLAALTAMQTTLYAQIDTHRRPYIAILTVIVMSLTIFICNLIN